MLRYQQPADEVFQEIVHEALDWMIEDLTESAWDPQAYPELLPRTAQLLDRAVALEALQQLKACSQAPEPYQPKPPHWVLLSEVLARYCELFNEQPYGAYGAEVHEKYGLRRLDYDRLLEVFLQEPALTQEAAHKGPIGPEALVPERVEDHAGQAQVIPANASPWYRRGTEHYPLGPEEQEDGVI